jgi:hypothetical protein
MLYANRKSAFRAPLLAAAKPSLSHFTGLFQLVAGAGVIFLLCAFLIPRNFLTDETEYLTEIVSLARGTPEGWGLRSFIYPALIAPFVWLAETVFGSHPLIGISAARAANLAVAGLSPIAAYLAGRAIGGRTCGLVALIFAVFPWTWAWAAGRVMMDVPAGSWLALMILPLLRERTRPLDTVVLVAFGSLAVFTKFQMGPAVLTAGLWHIAAQPDWMSRNRAALFTAGTAAVAIGIYCLSEYVLRGHPFSSLIEFYRYNIGDLEAFTQAYGPCQTAATNLTFTPLVFSYLLPVLAVFGGTFALLDRSRAMPILVVAIVYAFSLQLVCHKEPRYLVTLTPLVATLAGYGALRLLDVTAGWQLLGSVLGRHRAMVLSGGFALGVLAVVASLLPRGELSRLLAVRETCASFVFSTLDELESSAGDRPIALVYPCYVPDVHVHGYSIAFEDLGTEVGGTSHQRKLLNFREKAGRYGAVVVASGSDREEILVGELADKFSLLRRSPLGRYAIYVPRSGS